MAGRGGPAPDGFVGAGGHYGGDWGVHHTNGPGDPARRAKGGAPPLTAAPAAQQRLLDLQALDLKLDQLDHRRRTLPEVAERDLLAAEHSKLRDSEVTISTELADLEREQERADTDVEQVRRRKSRDQQRLDAGEVSSPKELESLQSEIASLDRRQASLEEVELEIMERLEDAQKRAAEVANEREDVARRAQEVQRARDAAWAHIDMDAGSAKQQ